MMMSNNSVVVSSLLQTYAIHSFIFELLKLIMFVALYNTMNNVAFPDPETNEVQIDVGEMKDPFESLEYAQKTTSDRSICLLKPNEGHFSYISICYCCFYCDFLSIN